jgi:hypothetical protein
MPQGLVNVKRPHPVTYVIILFLGYIEGMRSGGSWNNFFILLVGAAITYGGIRVAKYIWGVV